MKIKPQMQNEYHSLILPERTKCIAKFQMYKGDFSAIQHTPRNMKILWKSLR
jgi:hypothetical protein